MKFVHMADMHFDTSFTTLTNKADLGDKRRLDQRMVFKKIIDFIKENNIPFLFISGDLYEHEYIRQSTIEYINNLFKEIPNTRIFISPGNHDPFLKNSFYNRFKWNENVHIFGPEISVVELPEINIYGYGFNDFYYKNPAINSFELPENNKINVLITHGSLDGGYDDNRVYNPMSEKVLKEKGFDYIALGHIHKIYYNDYEDQRVAYPGSTISMGFDELGEHGILVGDISKTELKVEFVSMDNCEFVVKQIDMAEIHDSTELADRINNIDISENKYYKIELVGTRNFEIDLYSLKKLVFNNSIIKIKDLTKIGYNIQEIMNESTLRGLFAKEIYERMQANPEQKELLESALEIGFEILEV